MFSIAADPPKHVFKYDINQSPEHQFARNERQASSALLWAETQLKYTSYNHTTPISVWSRAPTSTGALGNDYYKCLLICYVRGRLHLDVVDVDLILAVVVRSRLGLLRGRRRGCLADLDLGPVIVLDLHVVIVLVRGLLVGLL